MKRPDISRLTHNRAIYLKIGFVVAIGFSILAFRWEVEAPGELEYEVEDAPAEIIQTVERTAHPEKQVQPPPPLVQTVSNEIETIETTFTPEPIPEKVDIITDDAPIEIDNTPVAPPVITPPIRPKREQKEPEIVIHDFVQYMPRFPGCEDQGLSEAELKQCAEKALYAFISKEIKYPTMAKETGIQGKVHIQFVVNEDGKISDIEVLRDAGGGLGKESQRVLAKMPDWIPGMQRNQNVKVRMRMPIKFTLDDF